MAEIVEGNLKIVVSRNNFGMWCWNLYSHHGEVYDPEYGERCIYKDEVVEPEDLVWRGLGDGGQERTEEAAWNAAAIEAATIEKHARNLAERAVAVRLAIK